MFTTKYLIKCRCDVCPAETDFQPTDELKLLQGWQFRQYMPPNGYPFFALTCSAECQQKWEKDHQRIGFVSSDDIALDEAVVIWLRTPPFMTNSYVIGGKVTDEFKIWR